MSLPLQQLEVARQVQNCAVFLLDPHGHVCSWNAGGERTKGDLAEDLLGCHLSVLYRSDDYSQVEEALQIASQTGHFESEGWRVREDGSQFWASTCLTALRNESGQLTGFAKITKDLTGQREAIERARSNELKFHLLMTGVQEYAIFLMDPEGRVTDWNSAAERLLGYSRDEIIGQHFSVFWTAEEGEQGGVADQELRQAVVTGRASDDRWHVRKDGTHFWANGITSALRDNDGNLRGFPEAECAVDRVA